MTHQPQKLPPFARELQPLEGWAWIHCGRKAWRVREREAAKGAHTCTIIYPADRSPWGYRWPVAGLECMVFGHDASLQLCQQLVVALIDAGALGVRLVHREVNDAGWIYYPSDLQACRKSA